MRTSENDERELGMYMRNFWLLKCVRHVILTVAQLCSAKTTSDVWVLYCRIRIPGQKGNRNVRKGLLTP